MFNNTVNSLRNTFGLSNSDSSRLTHVPDRVARKDYLGARDDLSSVGISGSKINAESGRSYITQDKLPVLLRERLNLPYLSDRNGNFALGRGNNSVGIFLARDQQVSEDHPQAYVAMKTLVSHEQAEREFATHKALGEDPRFVKGLDVSHVVQDGRSYLFMERMTGGDAKAHMENIVFDRKLSLEEKEHKMLEAVHGYLDCLKALHDKDFQHGDIDIGNFFHEAGSGRTAIGDFGSTRPATAAKKIDEAVELGMMFDREIRPMAKRAGIDTAGLDTAIRVLFRQHPDPRVQKDPIGKLLENWDKIKSQ